MAVTAGQIVAMGGGGLDPTSHLLEDFVVSLIPGQPARPRVCYVPTASGDPDAGIVRFYNAFPSDAYQPSHLNLFNRRVLDLDTFLHQQDVIYVGGGNTANMLAIWRIHGVDRILREVLTAGVVLCGSSAGALCWFEDGVTDSYGGHASLGDGLGFLDGNYTPHWDSEPARQAIFRELTQRSGRFGYATTDCAALHFKDGALAEVVTSKPSAEAFLFEPGPSRPKETLLPHRYLGGDVAL